MPPIVDAAKALTGEATQELAQFEPDPDGQGSTDGSREPVAAQAPDNPQWIVWPDAEGESAWAADELTQIGAGWS
jgi:hypothetical protein